MQESHALFHDLLIVLATASSLAAILFFLAWRRLHTAQKHIAPHEAAARLGAEIAELRERIEHIESLLMQPVAESGSPTGDMLYPDVQRLLNQGLVAEEIAGRLGLSRAEVDLISVLHSHQADTVRRQTPS